MGYRPPPPPLPKRDLFVSYTKEYAFYPRISDSGQIICFKHYYKKTILLEGYEGYSNYSDISILTEDECIIDKLRENH